MPLQNLDIHLLQVETARKHAGDVPAALHSALSSEQLDHAAILAVLDGAVRLRDHVCANERYCTVSRYRPPTPVGSQYITPEGAKRLRDELDGLWHDERPRVTA